jgi:hypothetical protein
LEGKSVKSKYWLILGLLFGALISIFLGMVNPGNLMSSNWTGPYYSAAHNLTLGGDFMVCPEQVLEFMDLDDPIEEGKYHFSSCKKPISYNHNPVGFAYVLKFSYFIFPFLGDQSALILLNIIVYLILGILLVYSPVCSTQKYFVFIFVFLNPFTLRFVGFNFYYIYTLIPGLFVALYMWHNKPKKSIYYSLAFLSAIVFSFRPVILPLIILLFLVILYRRDLRKLIFTTLIFSTVILVTYKPNDKAFFHTAYVGLAAYDESFGFPLSDDAGYNHYGDRTGETINASFGGNYYADGVMKKYNDVLKTSYIDHLKDHPLMALRNVFFNFGSIAFLGYHTFLPSALKVALSILGAIVLLFAVFIDKRNGVVLFIVCTIAIIYPPIPAYILYVYPFLGFMYFSVYKWLREKHYLPFSK